MLDRHLAGRRRGGGARLFGWESEDTMPPDVPGRHFVCRLRGRDIAAIASRPRAAPAVTAWNTYVWVERADQAAAAAIDAGGGGAIDPFESLDGGRLAVVADPAGATIGRWQPGTHRGAQLVNEPGGWAMSQQQTPDPEGAEAFYGTVFGWQAKAFGRPEDGSRSGSPSLRRGASSNSRFLGTSSRRWRQATSSQLDPQPHFPRLTAATSSIASRRLRPLLRVEGRSLRRGGGR